MILRLLVCCLGLLAPGPVLGDAAEAYATGRGLLVVIGGRSLDADRARLGCAGCHGADGRGGREGGAASAPPILWSDLSAPTRLRPAYDEAAFLRALTQGLDPAGRALQMPRFAAPPALLSGLRAHLAALQSEQRLGIARLRIAVRLPNDPDRRAAVLAAMADFNAEGGSWGHLVTAAQPDGPWFLDLDAALDALLARLRRAEDQAADRALAEDPRLKRLPRPDPRAALLLADGQDTWFIGPPPGSVVWARRQGLSLDAARVHALTGLILSGLRAAGPAVTRSAMGELLRDLDPGPAVVRESVSGRGSETPVPNPP